MLPSCSLRLSTWYMILMGFKSFCKFRPRLLVFFFSPIDAVLVFRYPVHPDYYNNTRIVLFFLVILRFTNGVTHLRYCFVREPFKFLINVEKETADYVDGVKIMEKKKKTRRWKKKKRHTTALLSSCGRARISPVYYCVLM